MIFLIFVMTRFLPRAEAESLAIAQPDIDVALAL